MVDKKELVKQLYIVFGGEKPPSKFSHGCPRQRCVELELWFANKPRENYTDENIMILSGALSILSTEAVLYVLPPIIEVGLKDISLISFDTFIQSFILSPDAMNYGKKEIYLLSLVNKEQKRLIRKILEIWAKEVPEWQEDIVESLKYWD